MTVPTPAGDGPPREPGVPESDESPPTVPSFTKGRHMTVHLPTDDDSSMVVEHHDEPGAEYVEPYVPMPSGSKYDRRASGAAAEPTDGAVESAEMDGALTADREAQTEQIEVDLTDEALPLPPAPVVESVYERELRELEERASAARAAAPERADPFVDPDGLTYWQRHSAHLPRLEEESD